MSKSSVFVSRKIPQKGLEMIQQAAEAEVGLKKRPPLTMFYSRRSKVRMGWSAC